MQTKSISRRIKQLAVPLIFILIHGCSQKQTKIELSNKHFTRQLFDMAADSLTTAELKQLRAEHGRFFNLWLDEIIDFAKYGEINDTVRAFFLNDFLQK